MQGKEIEHSSLEIKLKRFDRVYSQGDTIEGTVLVKVKDGWSHNGILLRALGGVYLRNPGRSMGLFTSFSEEPYNTVFSRDVEVLDGGRLANGVTEIPFSLSLDAASGQLLETYHGVCVSVAYRLIVTCDRGVMKKGLVKEIEFIVEVPQDIEVDPEPKEFVISNDTINEEDVRGIKNLPEFEFIGKVHRTSCPINLPFTGEITIKKCEEGIRTIEVQMVRVETVSGSDSGSREATEIQSIQIGDGDVARSIAIPIYVVFPRLFTCPTLISPDFTVEFEANLVIGLESGYTVVESFPISLHRGL